MTEYIERERLLINLAEECDKYNPKLLNGSHIHHGISLAANIIKSQPVADAEKIRHGKWNEVVGMAPPELHGLHFCSLCSEFALQKKHKEYLSNYCPNCGAEMSGGDE